MENKRRHSREPSRTKVRLMIDGQWHEGVITNSSAAGVRLYLRLNIATGKAVRIEIADYGQYDATVIWCEGDETGLKLEHDPAEIAGMLKALAS